MPRRCAAALPSIGRLGGCSSARSGSPTAARKFGVFASRWPLRTQTHGRWSIGIMTLSPGGSWSPRPSRARISMICGMGGVHPESTASSAVISFDIEAMGSARFLKRTLVGKAEARPARGNAAGAPAGGYSTSGSRYRRPWWRRPGRWLGIVPKDGADPRWGLCLSRKRPRDRGQNEEGATWSIPGRLRRGDFYEQMHIAPFRIDRTR